jgi:hypothetical protein
MSESFAFSKNREASKCFSFNNQKSPSTREDKFIYNSFCFSTFNMASEPYASMLINN